MTKIYINEEGRPMWNPKWPKSEDYVVVCDGGQHGHFEDEMYQKALEKAKAEAVYFEDEQYMYVTYQGLNWKPGTFIEIDAEVEVRHQYKVNGLWRDASEENCWKYSNERGCETRKVARIKKQESGAHSFTEAAEIPQMPADEKSWREKAHEEDKQRYVAEDNLFKVIKNSLISVDVAAVDADDIANGILADVSEYINRENAELKAKLEKSEERVKELNKFVGSITELHTHLKVTHDEKVESHINATDAGNKAFFRGKAEAYGYAARRIMDAISWHGLDKK